MLQQVAELITNDNDEVRGINPHLSDPMMYLISNQKVDFLFVETTLNVDF